LLTDIGNWNKQCELWAFTAPDLPYKLTDLAVWTSWWSSGATTSSRESYYTLVTE